MRYWKCMGYNRDEGNFTIGRIYESDNDGYNVISKNGYKFIATSIEQLDDWYEFKEVTRRDYLFQLQKEGKLKFDEQDFINGDLAVEFIEECGFSIKLRNICDTNNIRNFYNFNSRLRYAVICKEVQNNGMKSGINKLPFVNAKNIAIEFTSKQKNECDDFTINIASKNGTTTCTYDFGEYGGKETVKLYYKDEFNVEIAVQEVLKKVFHKKPHELFEYKLENKLGRKPTAMELVEAYRKEIK